MLAFVLALFAPRRARAADPLDPKAVPEPLKPWTAWVLEGHDDALCVTLLEHADTTRCLWPARIELALAEHGGRFTQAWHVDAKSWAPLPGDAKRWPTDVSVDGKRAVVVENGGAPRVLLERGDHTVTGSFAWDSLPESLHVPAETGLLGLTLRGARVASPNRDAQGTVWLQKAATNEEGDALTIVVHRKITDDIPLEMTTRLELHVAGKSREELLGKALPPGFVPMALGGDLPARLEPDTRVRVQVRPGVFAIELRARAEGPVHALTRPAPDGPWREGDEVWVFDARNDLRVVTPSGPPSIDPQQTTLPDAWKKLPAYTMAVGATLTLTETRRGDADPPPNQLSLSRTLWLDFEGGGYTAHDTITGTLTRDSRLTMAPPTELGRVAIGGKDQFITRLPGGSGGADHGPLGKEDAKAPGGAGATGVEIRQGSLDVSADSRIPGESDIPAVSWAHDFHQVSGTLHLPPGWRLLHASGVDDVPGTWVGHWSLLELFLALVIAIAIARLYGTPWGIAALVMLALTFPEEGAPKWSWVGLLVIEALFRVLPAGRVKALFAGARVAAVAIVAIVAIPFLVRHVREGMHPVLEEADVDVASAGPLEEDETRAVPLEAPRAEPAPAAPAAPPAAPAPAQGNATGDLGGDQSGGARRNGGPGAAVPLQRMPAKPAPSGTFGWSSGSASDYRTLNAQVYDPSAIVQTGPGLPRWSWKTLDLKWSGPVTASQRLHLFLLSPPENLLLAFVRAALLAIVFARLLPWSQRFWPRRPGSVTVVAAGLALVLAPSLARADLPDKELLDDLQGRLLRKPECLPSCASSGRMLLDASGDTLRLRVEVDAAAPVAVPLPGRSPQWSPATVLLDGQPAKGLARQPDGTLWMELAAGPHQIVAAGPLPDGASMQLALPMKPHRVDVTAQGWSVAGVHEDGLADDDLQLTRIEKKEAGGDAGGGLEPGELPPFARVQRTLLVGLDWQVETRVVRVTPPGAAIVLDVPLLPGERVTTADVHVVGGKAQVNLGPNVNELTWRGALEQQSPVKLVAPKTLSWIEEWRVDVGPVWHAAFSGIPFVHTEPIAGVRIPTWRPWPGEEASVAITRPDGVPGQTLTIDRSTTDLSPGLRATDVSLAMSIRSSRGAQHTVMLPDGAELESLTIDGKTQPIRQDGRKVTIPVTPGAQEVAIAWREPVAIGPWFGAPAIDLGAPSVNASIALHVPAGRWLLLAGGPRVGPAVLFWSLLVVLVVVAIGLGRNRWTPLRTGHWLLLAIGLSQVDVWAGAVVVGWLLALGWRARREKEPRSAAWFDLVQLGLVAWTIAAVVVLFVAVYQGLLGTPDLQVRGNGSSAECARWFVDRSDAALVRPWIVSAPVLVYRAAMLAWALWLALAVLGWIKWGWGAFTTGGAWRKAPPRPMPVRPPFPVAPPAASAPQTEPMPPQTEPAPTVPGEPPKGEP